MNFTLFKTGLFALLTVASTLLAPTVQASLIVNGSFEDNVIKNHSWSWFNANQVNGWDGSNIEIWRNFNGVVAADGQQFMELNAHGSNTGAWSIFQSFNTVVGARYELTFAYRARVNSSEAFSVSVAGLKQTLTNHTPVGWSLFQGYFTADSTQSTLRFTSLNSGTYGNFIDAVSVNTLPTLTSNRQPVSSPATIGLLLLAGAGIAWRRRQQA